MPLLWLRISVALYGVGLLYALMALGRRSQAWAHIALPAVGLGMVFQFVSMVETSRLEGHLAPASIHDSEALLAFLLMVFFMAIYARYRTLTPGIFIFPLVF